MRSSRVKAAAVLGLSALLVSLAACSTDSSGSPSASPSASAPSSAATSASPTPTPTPTPKPVKPSTNLNAITVTGGYGKQPKVSVKAPWAVDKTTTKVLEPSKGAAVKAGQTVEVNYYAVNGRTGKMFDDSFATGQPVSFNLDQVVPGFSKGLVGQRQGSRVLIAMPGSDGYDGSGGNPNAGIEVGDTLIFVVDLVTVQLAGPEGTAVAPKAGLPSVVAKSGVPQITIPKSDPPTKLQAETLIQGKGKKVGANDTITFDYRWVRWSDGKTLESSYGQQPATAQLAGLLPGMVTGLTGKAVGSRVLLVIPPAQGYPDGNPTPSVAPGETLVILVDLLFTHAQ